MGNSTKNRQKRTKRPAIFDREMRIKLGVTVSIIVIMLVFLSAILIYKNNVNGDEYSINVLEQQNYSSTTIPYKRGDILDRNGVVLATSIKVYNLILDPKIILSDNGKYTEDSINALADCFGYDRQELLELINENSERRYYVYEKKLSYEDIKDFLDAKADEDRYPNLQGVWFETEYERKYPFSSLACNLIGFTSSGNVGTWGIEEYYNDYLNGVDGRSYGYVNNENVMEHIEKKAEDGDTVISTIDFNIQSIIEKYIAQYNEEIEPENIGIIIMDPRNGEVLAMAGKLSYDLNNPRDLTAFYTEEEIAGMNDEDKLNALNNIWRNYCISDSYEPGSTAKPYTIAAALDEGIIKTDDKYICDGFERIGGWTIRCHTNEGHGTIDMYGAIANSCNDALMAIASAEGAEIFTTYQKRFNFGMKTRIDLPGEASCANLLYSASKMGPVDLATNSFGQNYNVTMIQMAAAYSSLINGGYYYSPRVVKQIVNSNGGVVESADKILVKQTITSETSNEIKKGLRMCVESGTGRTAGIEGYLIAGKTGTAERQPRSEEKYLLSFIGFAPYDTPQLLCYVVVDNPNVENQSTTYATTLFKGVMEEVLTYLNIFPDAETEPVPPVQPQVPGEPQTSGDGNTQVPGEPQTSGDGNTQVPGEPQTADDGNTQTPTSGDNEEVFPNGIMTEDNNGNTAPAGDNAGGGNSAP